MKKYITKWRKYGALVCLAAQLTSLFGPYYLVSGFFCMAMVTVPCGIKWINRTTWAWCIRQAFFFINGILIITRH